MHNKNPQQPDHKNLIIAIVLSLLILGLFHFFYEKPRIAQLEQERRMMQEMADSNGGGDLLPDADIDVLTQQATQAQTDQSPKPRKDIRLKIDNDAVKGSINLVGGRIDDLILKDYYVTLAREQNVKLLAPSRTAHPYYGQFGWLAAAGVAVPDSNTIWTLKQGEKLTPQTPVTMRWDNGQGQIFEKEIAIDDHYLFTIKQRVINNASENITLFPYGLLARINLPDWAIEGRFLQHEGPIGYLDGELREIDYSDLHRGRAVEIEDRNGWLGITDKYWLTALIPPAGDLFKTRFLHSNNQQQDQYQVDMRGEPITIPPQGITETTMHFFAGAKKLNLLEKYERQLGIDHFDMAIDFGWFYFMTKPFFKALAYIGGLVGNFGIAILIFTVFIRILVFPLANKAYRSMARMKTLMPEMQKIKERYGKDKQLLQKNIMELYQRENVNPFSGCLPILIQIPIFFALYKVLYVTIEMRHAPFYGWILDLSQPDPTSIFNLFGLLPFTPPSLLMIGALPLIMGFTMFLQQRLNPPPADPIHRTMMAWFPVIITVVLAGFPAGLVLYWAWNNTLSILQQWFIMRTMGIRVNLLKRPEDDDIVEAQKQMQKERQAKKERKMKKKNK